MTTSTNEKIEFPLVDSSYDNQEILSCIATLLSGQLTMGEKVRTFERQFADFCGSPYAIMVNSGSSANLLALSVLTNPLRKLHLKPGDKVGVPAVCWSTSLWPIIQTGLTPVLLDADPYTFNLSISSLKEAVSRHDLKAILAVHILGNSTELDALLDIVHEKKLVLIEDTCESLGSTFKTRMLGTFGAFGTFSFYFSHHMTTIEGGMVLAQTEEDFDLLKCLRTHGWSREHSNRAQFESENDHIDPRFLFVNLGYNLRPMEIQAAFGIEQLKRLNDMNQHRRINFTRIQEAFRNHPLWQEQLIFPTATPHLNACWFGFSFLIKPLIHFNCKTFRKTLLDRGIDTRPIISGNMAVQPAIRHFNVDLSMGPFPGAQAIHERGFYIGCHAKPLADSRIEKLADLVLRSFEECT